MTSKTTSRPRGPNGFTLVELMIALVLTGVFAGIAWTMFTSSSEILAEVDSLTDTSDRLRFAMERVRTDFQMAGSLSTPDSASDPWVQPKQDSGSHYTTSWRVAGIIPYAGWETRPTNDSSGDPLGTAPVPFMDQDILDANPNVSADGVILVGAYDYPLPFEITDVQTSGTVSASSFDIPTHQRGLQRLHVADPFRVGQHTYDAQSFAGAGDIAWLDTSFDARLVRVRDRQGYLQFGHLKDAPTWDSADSRATVDLANTHSLVFKFGTAASSGNVTSTYGLDRGASDVGYEAAFLDAYWYYVRVDPNNPQNSQLVRERLCAPELMADLESGPGSVQPLNVGVDDGTCGYSDRELVVVADQVVDFQIWFDCGTSANNGNVQGSNFGLGWFAPRADNDCMQTASTNYEPGRARVAHVRLSMRTRNERSDILHYQFEDSTGVSDTPTGLSTLRTFDIVPNLEGAAQVVTLQADFELPNFAMANLED